MFWRITRLLGDYKWLTIAGFALAFAQMGLGLVTPRIIELTINNALLDRRTGLLVTYGLILLGVALLRFAVAVGRRLTTGTVSLGIEYDLRNRLWSHLLRQPAAYFDRWPTGQLMSRTMSDVQNVRMFLGYGLVFFSSNAVMMVAVVVLLFVLNWQLALASMAFLPALVVVTVRFSRRLRPILQDVQQRIADVTEAAEENVVGSRIVRIFAREDDEVARFSARNYRVFEASVAAARMRAVHIPLIAFIPNLAVAVLLYFGGRQVVDGQMTLGALVAFYSYLMMFIYPARIIGWVAGLAQRAIASGNRVFEILDAPLEMVERPDARPLAPRAAGAGGKGSAGAPPTGALPASLAGALSADDSSAASPPVGAVTFDDVSFAYAGRPVLDSVTLEVPAGSTIALVGHTGSGKTTLTNLIPRFYDVDEGRVLVDGQDVRDLQLDDLRSHMAIVNQDPFLFSTSIAENIRLGRPEASDEEVLEAARAAQVDEFVAALPEGYATVIGERGFTLSGGQRQRIAIARALIVDPRILILDDATSSVDAETELKIRRALQKATRGRTTFIIAHRPSTISLADEIVVLDKGRVMERGTHAALMADDTLYARMFGRAEAERCNLDVVEIDVPAVDAEGPAR